eukprot:355515-Chlamydomonas_euryale.AAC.18
MASRATSTLVVPALLFKSRHGAVPSCPAHIQNFFLQLLKPSGCATLSGPRLPPRLPFPSLRCKKTTCTAPFHLFFPPLVAQHLTSAAGFLREWAACGGAAHTVHRGAASGGQPLVLCECLSPYAARAGRDAGRHTLAAGVPGRKCPSDAPLVRCAVRQAARGDAFAQLTPRSGGNRPRLCCA